MEGELDLLPFTCLLWSTCYYAPSHCGGYELGWEVDPRDGSVAVGGRSWLDGGPRPPPINRQLTEAPETSPAPL